VTPVTVSSERFKGWLAGREAPLCVGIAGGSGSGKTTLAHLLRDYAGADRSIFISQDSYYIDQSHLFDEDGGKVNFDHPSSLDWDLLARHLSELKAGRGVDCPIYDFATHSRSRDTVRIEPQPLVIVDGILILDSIAVRESFHFSAFVRATEEVRFARRLERDVRERGRTREGVEKQFMKQVKPMHDQFVEPSLIHAHCLANGEAALGPAFAELVESLWNHVNPAGH